MSDKTHPFNPYYICLWYMAYLFLVATWVLAASDETIHSLYLFLQGVGAEDFLLSSRRLNSMHQYLVETGNTVRWEHLTCYFTFLAVGFVITLPIALIPAGPRLAWFATVEEGWQRPLTPTEKKFGGRFLAFTLGYAAVMFWGQTYYISNWDRRGRGVDNIHAYDTGYFHMAISTALVIGAFQLAHLVICRFRHNCKMITKQTTNQGEQP